MSALHNETGDESTDERTIEVGDNIAYREDIDDSELAPDAAILSGPIDSYGNLERRLYRIDRRYVLAVRYDASSTPRGPKDIIVDEVGTDIEATILGIEEPCDWLLDNGTIYDARWPSDLYLSIDLDGFTADEIEVMRAESGLDMAVEVKLV